MKIKKILKLQNLGLYKDFAWDNNCPEFKQFNFFYGWNYSGKTSLSRLFRCLEKKIKHQDYPNIQFQLDTDINRKTSGKISEKDIGDEFPVRVFNEDFVEENFRWDDENHKINPVLVLGKESIDLREQLKENEAKKQKIEEDKTKVEKELNEKKTELEKVFTNKASEIRQILGITNPREFDKNNLNATIRKFETNFSDNIFTDDEEKQQLDLYRNQTKYESVNTLSFDLKANSIYQEVKNVCERRITAQQIIEKLKSNPELNQWVKTGLDLHKKEKCCQFCGNRLPNDLFDKLQKHYSDGYDQLMQDLKKLEEEINTHRNYISNIQFTDKARLYPELAEQYEQRKEELKKKLQGDDSDYINLLNTLIKKIEEKRNKPFDSLNIDLSTTELDEHISQCVKELNNIIENNNTKIKQSEDRQQLKKKLIKHYSAKFIEEIKYLDFKKEMDELEKQKNEKQKELDDTYQAINDINSQIKQANIGAEKINNYLQQFFRDDQIKLNPLDEGTYQLKRAENIAKNLSTGEKNIISLIYFITKLEEDNFDKPNAIVFIDDPVSSLDSNHIFQVYGFLSEKLKGCGQVFITTHNFDFFNLLKDMVKSDPDGTPKKEKENYYLIKKVQSNDEKISTMAELPKVLRKFKSEYNYLFSTLKEFNDSNDKSNFELLYMMPNIARRFLESYLFAKYPDGSRFKEKVDKFFKDFNDDSTKRTTLKILDEYSHEENSEHTQKFPDINEIEPAVKTILEVLESKDKEHYDALCTSLKQENPPHNQIR